MEKWFGKIGYGSTVETVPGVWKEQIIERSYFGEVSDNSRGLYSGDKVNSDITVSNKISILSDPFTENNFHSIRYVEFMGAKWTVSNVLVKRPKLILTLGGLYNGEQA